jgi:biopolymer transport protein ExbD
VPRNALLTLTLLALATCGSEPDPAQQAVLDRLAEIDARLARLEARLQSDAAAPTVPEIAKAPYDAKLPAKIRLHVGAETIRFGDEPLPDEALVRRIEAAVRLHGDPTVIVQADPEIGSSRMVEVIDLLKRAGIRRLAIATTSDDPIGDTDEVPAPEE